MEKNENDPSDENQGVSDKMLDKAATTLNWWNRAASINADDPFWVGVIKIGIRIIGILILLAISPFVIIGLILGFIAAG